MAGGRPLVGDEVEGSEQAGREGERAARFVDEGEDGADELGEDGSDGSAPAGSSTDDEVGWSVESGSEGEVAEGWTSSVIEEEEQEAAGSSCT